MINNTFWPKPDAGHNGRRVGGRVDLQRTFSAPRQNLVWPIKRSPDSPWPFNSNDVSPLRWWRTLPSHELGHSERALLLATLKSISVLNAGSNLKSALAGDPMAAMDVAFSLMPVKELTLTVDIAMTALCHLSLAPNATLALVMAQVTGLTDLDHGLSIDLALSWYKYGLRNASDPRKFRESETVPLRAFEERDRSGKN